MTPEEYRERAHAIEAKANEDLAAARRSFNVLFPAHRAARYASGMGDVIREMAIAPIRDRIEAEMHAAMERLDEEFYEQT